MERERKGKREGKGQKKERRIPPHLTLPHSNMIASSSCDRNPIGLNWTGLDWIELDWKSRIDSSRQPRHHHTKYGAIKPLVESIPTPSHPSRTQCRMPWSDRLHIQASRPQPSVYMKKGKNKGREKERKKERSQLTHAGFKPHHKKSVYCPSLAVLSPNRFAKPPLF